MKSTKECQLTSILNRNMLWFHLALMINITMLLQQVPPTEGVLMIPFMGVAVREGTDINFSSGIVCSCMSSEIFGGIITPPTARKVAGMGVLE